MNGEEAEEYDEEENEEDEEYDEEDEEYDEEGDEEPYDGEEPYEGGEEGEEGGEHAMERQDPRELLATYRVVPASPSYFTALPQFTDDLLRLQALQRKYSALPTLAPGQQARVVWQNYRQYTVSNPEPIRKAAFAKMVTTLQRLSRIHPAVMPDEVHEAMKRYKAAVQPGDNPPDPLLVDAYGRSRAVGRRELQST